MQSLAGQVLAKRLSANVLVVCERLGQLGTHVISLDELAREAVRPGSPVLKAVVEHFGRDILTADGSLDRGKLRGIITRDAEARKALERLTHPEILRLFEKKIAAIKSRQEDAVVVAEVPLLIEVGMQDRFDVVILVEADSEHQKSRLMARNGSSVESAAALLGIQMTPEEKRPHADYVVENRGTLEELEGPVKEIYAKIIKGAPKGLTH
ncbi:MAG: dephospho-CoA kinase [Deltaproteobacteria bacterium]|nr:dephospho-CoA kinase [Deltaproteobacteria bacterium]